MRTLNSFFFVTLFFSSAVSADESDNYKFETAWDNGGACNTYIGNKAKSRLKDKLRSSAESACLNRKMDLDSISYKITCSKRDWDVCDGIFETGSWISCNGYAKVSCESDE